MTTITRFLISILTLVIFSNLNLKAQKETFKTKDGALTISPILHSSLVIEWNDLTIFSDPYGGADKYAAFSAPDLVLITDIHGDHLNLNTLSGLDLSKTTLIAPEAVIAQLKGIEFAISIVLDNGKTAEWNTLQLEAIPMYNLPETEDSRHPKGRGNGYILTLGEKRIYISGDTEDIVEMRGLKDIDIAFVCMNIPYTMEVEQAAEAVLEFKPKVVYPFHYRGKGGFSDVKQFKALVNAGDSKEEIEVRLLDWYPED